MEQEQYKTLNKYDLQYAKLHDVSKLFTKPSTIKIVEQFTGASETFTVETIRHPDKGDYVFLERVDDTCTSTRICLPPKVVNAIVSHRDSLTVRRRRIAGKVQAQARKDRGEVPGFMKSKKRP